MTYSTAIIFNDAEDFFFFFTYSQLGPSFSNLSVKYSQSELLLLKPLCSEAPGRDSNPGWKDLWQGH